MVFLDANPVIYYIEQSPAWGPKAAARLAALRTAGEKLAATELVRMECLVGPVKTGNTAMQANFAAFFSAPDLVMLSITTAVAQRAATLRATYKFHPLDSLHLAAAIEHGCTSFLTNDAPLARCRDIPVEILT